jgi:hypothetical protein
MSTQRSFRLSGLAVVVGGVVSIVCQLVGAVYNGNTTTYAAQPIYITSEFALAAATALLLLGLPGIYASRARGFGVVGLVGMALLFIAGIMLGVFANLEDAMVTPWLAAQAPSLADGFGPPPFFAFYNVQELASLSGSVLLAIPLLRRRVSPRWPAITLLLSAGLGVVTFFFDAFPSNLASGLLVAVPPMLLLVALAALGYQTWTQPTPDSLIGNAQPSVETARPATTTTNLGGVR